MRFVISTYPDVADVVLGAKAVWKLKLGAGVAAEEVVVAAELDVVDGVVPNAV